MIVYANYGEILLVGQKLRNKAYNGKYSLFTIIEIQNLQLCMLIIQNIY